MQIIFSASADFVRLNYWMIHSHLLGLGWIPGASFTKPPLKRTSFSKGKLFLFLWEGNLKILFHKASFNSP